MSSQLLLVNELKQRIKSIHPNRRRVKIVRHISGEFIALFDDGKKALGPLSFKIITDVLDLLGINYRFEVDE